VVETVALLFAELGSATPELACTVLVIVTVLVPWIMRVTLTVPPAARLPKLQFTAAPAGVQEPWLVCTDTKAVPRGKLSCRVTLLARVGPSLYSAMVYVTTPFTVWLEGEPLIVTFKSALDTGVIYDRTALFAKAGS
jgi:hypothetical protein